MQFRPEDPIAFIADYLLDFVDRRDREKQVGKEAASRRVLFSFLTFSACLQSETEYSAAAAAAQARAEADRRAQALREEAELIAAENARAAAVAPTGTPFLLLIFPPLTFPRFPPSPPPFFFKVHPVEVVDDGRASPHSRYTGPTPVPEADREEATPMFPAEPHIEEPQIEEPSTDEQTD